MGLPALTRTSITNTAFTRQGAKLGIKQEMSYLHNRDVSVITNPSCSVCPQDRSHGVRVMQTAQRMQVGRQEAPRNVPTPTACWGGQLVCCCGSLVSSSTSGWFVMGTGVTSWSCRFRREGCTCLSISCQIVSLGDSLGRNRKTRSTSERIVMRSVRMISSRPVIY